MHMTFCGANHSRLNLPQGKVSNCSMGDNLLFYGICISVLALQLFLPAASVYLAMMALLCSGDIEPNPGPTARTGRILKCIMQDY
eukprot:scaffold195075_cov21-Prasinocladus_malaysianus.AAC.1